MEQWTSVRTMLVEIKYTI